VRSHRRPPSAAAGARRAPRPCQAAAPPRRSRRGRAQDAARGDGPARVPRQAALHPLLRAAGRRPGPDDRPPLDPARRARGSAPAGADDAAADDGGRQGRHPQDPVAALRRRTGRVRPDALPRPRHRVRVEPGRLRDGLSVLRHRPGRSPAQHVDRGDRRAGRRGAACAHPGRGRRRSGARLQRRVHGDGRAARQLQGRHRRRTTPHRPRARGPGHVRPGRDGLHRRPGASDPPADRGGRPRHPRPEPARARRRAAQRAGADQHPLLRRRDRRRRLGLRRADQAPGVHRVRHDARHQRPGVARRPPGRRAARPGRLGLGARQPHPAQPDAGLEVDGLGPARRAGVRPPPRGEGHPHHRARHPRTRDRRRLRPAGGDRVL
ncbi:MAG: 23S rRNA (adenine(2503)-C(2))-methyltransferase @ tRNA (adenine(37)-C(2))-methyltransferase, partial [uncultured Nocardioides sp.]